MLSSLIEWFIKRILLEKVKHDLFSDDDSTERDIENELYNTFVRDTEEFELTPPTGGEDEEPVVLNRPDEEIYGEIINLASGQDTTPEVTCVDITYDAAILDYLPSEERTENVIGFWFQKDNIDISFNENSRIGPLFSVYIPSTRKSNIRSGIEATKEIISRVVYGPTHLLGITYEALEAGFGLDDLFEDTEELTQVKEEIGEEETKETIQFLLGSAAGYDPDYRPELTTDEEQSN